MTTINHIALWNCCTQKLNFKKSLREHLWFNYWDVECCLPLFNGLFFISIRFFVYFSNTPAVICTFKGKVWLLIPPEVNTAINNTLFESRTFTLFQITFISIFGHWHLCLEHKIKYILKTEKYPCLYKKVFWTLDWHLR